MKLLGIDFGRKYIAIKLNEKEQILIMFRQSITRGIYNVEYEIQPTSWKKEIDASPGITAAIRELAHAARFSIRKVISRHAR